jgi:restriction system protein
MLLGVLSGVRKSLMTALISDIMDQSGTPQHPLDWTNPDQWIAERLSGPQSDLAKRIWLESDRTINPRHLRGSYYFIGSHQLLDVDANGVYQVTGRSEAFRNNDSELVRQIDESESLPQLLGILATKTLAKRADLLPEWSEYLREHTNYRSESSIKSALHYRMQNLKARGLVTKDGVVYSITPAGLEYAAPLSEVLPAKASEQQPHADPRRAVTRAIAGFNQSQVELLRERLGEMPPYLFEHLVRDLLEAMGYEDVLVTKESGDKGVDVVATVQFGITTITEVVQVKRHQGAIGRPTLDQLRGALPYHGAIRGTIITLGKFSSGCVEAALFPGAAPISLVDGTRLVDLLVEHEIGIRKRPATLYEIDSDFFAQASESQQLEESLLEQDISA